MIVTFWLVVVPAVGVCLWTAISPRSVWYRVQAWRYRYPDLNEPSGDEYQLRRWFAVVGLLILIPTGVGLLVEAHNQNRQEAQQRQREVQKQRYFECRLRHYDPDRSEVMCATHSPQPVEGRR